MAITSMVTWSFMWLIIFIYILNVTKLTDLLVSLFVTQLPPSSSSTSSSSSPPLTTRSVGGQEWPAPIDCLHLPNYNCNYNDNGAECHWWTIHYQDHRLRNCPWANTQTHTHQRQQWKWSIIPPLTLHSSQSPVNHPLKHQLPSDHFTLGSQQQHLEKDPKLPTLTTSNHGQGGISPTEFDDEFTCIRTNTGTCNKSPTRV